MQRAIIHIGMPRTGTTTLQRILHDLRPELARRGVLYPDLTPASAAEPHLSHQHLGETLDGRRPARERRELLARLAAGLAGADIVLLSYESLVLGRGRHRAAKCLAGLFEENGFTPELLVTVKPQADYINSMYTWRTQFLKEDRGFASFAAAAVASPHLRYDRLIAPWCAVAGGRLTAVALHDPCDPAPLVTRILDRVGLAARIGDLIGSAETALVENRSPGPLATEVSRRLTGWRIPPGSARDITRAVEQRARKRGDVDAFQGFEEGQATEIMQRFEAANARFAHVAWRKPWADCVASAPARVPTELRPGGVKEAVIQDVLAEITALFALRPLSSVRRRWQRVACLAAVITRQAR